ncbi:hypothetical protein DMENIID0001_019060 [Sergentomyia squamirostris]
MYKVCKPIIDLYRKNPELKEKNVQQIGNWIEEQRHLPKLTESEIAIFLHAKYYDVPDTKSAIEKYYTFKTKHENIFAKRDPSDECFNEVINSQLHIPLPHATTEGYRAILIKMLNPDPANFNFLSTIRTCSMVFDWWLMAEGLPAGHVVVVDMNCLSAGHILKLNISILRAFITYCQELVPARLKGIHFINATFITEKVISILKPFLKKEISAIIKVHLKMETVFEVIPKENFPKELDGSWKTIKELQEDMRELLLGNRENFLEEDVVRRVYDSLKD